MGVWVEKNALVEAPIEDEPFPWDSPPATVAALYVEEAGPYAGQPGVEVSNDGNNKSADSGAPCRDAKQT